MEIRTLNMPAHCQSTDAAGPSSEPLHELLETKSMQTPDALAFRFLVDGEQDEETVTLRQLHERALSLASRLLDHGAEGRPVLLIRPPGIGFIVGLFACWQAGAIAVPAYPPRGSRHRQRMQAILNDCGAELAIAAANQTPIDGVTLVSSGETGDFQKPQFTNKASPHDPCLLQYTSGSTAEPKGVMISHHNLRSHFKSLGFAEELGLKSAVSWLPPYHDMGLVLKILHAFEADMPLTFFSPEHFIQRPARWLRAISRYRAELSGAPNFAFEACINTVRDEEIQGIDLSCWKSAACGAERIRAETLERFTERFAPYGFRAESFMTGYGLAEATLIVTSSPVGLKPRISENPHAGRLVSCGIPVPGVELRVVNPDTGKPCMEREIGEIQIKGPCVSSGYWRNDAATRETFGDETLRSGDLGYMEDGHLYVSGRIKDLIILDGVNHAAEDIESALLTHVPEITMAAAFAMEHAGNESLVIAVETSAGSHAVIAARIRQELADSLGLSTQRVVFTRHGLLPRTTSGKIRRSACRKALTDGSMRILHDDDASAADLAGGDMLAIVMDSVKRITGRLWISCDDDVIDLGMGSLDVTRLVAELRAHTGINILLGEVFLAGSFAKVAMMLTSKPVAEGGLSEIIPGTAVGGSLLSHAQERMWFLHQFNPQSAAYHVFGTLELRGGLSTAHMREAFRRVIGRHDILMSRHGSEGGRPNVWIDRENLAEFIICDSEDDESLMRELRSFSNIPFDLNADSPIRAMLIGCGSERHVLAVCVHHIVADGWSLRLLARELSESYSALVAGDVAAESPRGISYQDYAAAHRGWVDGGAVDAQVEFWKNHLAGCSGLTQLPMDSPRTQQPSSDGELVIRRVPEDLVARIAELAGKHRATPFMVHLAALFLLLRQHGASRDAVVAIPVANRNHASAADLIGTLVNTLPFRMTLDHAESFSSLLERVRAASFAMQENQDAPFERIIDLVKPERARDHAPLAQIMFDHQEIPIPETWAGNLECRYFQAHRGAAQFDLSLLLTVFNDHQQLAFEYRTELFREQTVAAMLDRHLANLANLCTNPDAMADSCLRLTDHDRDWLAKVSNGQNRSDFLGKTTLSLFQDRAANCPLHNAAHAEGRSISYQELDRTSDHIAAALCRRGILPGDRVAVMLERDPLLPATLLAIWKAGAAYVPLDSSNPTERLRLILSGHVAPHIIASAALTGYLPEGMKALLIDELLADETTTDGLPGVSPSDAAYVIHTSGSTGIPKGVVVSHEALANFLLSMAETPGFTSADRLLAVTTISFDISTLELFLPLIMGGVVEIVSTETARDGHALLERMRSKEITVMQATPATWRLLLNAGWQGTPDLKILCGGEAMDLPLAAELVRMGCQLWNLYGPTETTVWSTLWRVPNKPEHVRIGRPITNTGVHIVSEDGEILPPGVTGSLWISGAGLAEGYWKRPDLTEKRFSILTCENGRQVRAYHTGDNARWHSNGTLECLGRSDGQVKIRGFRVELGEIEAALACHPLVSQAKAALRGLSPVAEKLVAWITLSSPVANTATIRNHLTDRLPLHMIPADIVVINAFPLNSSGKVDVKQLPDPEPQIIEAQEVTATERALMEIWSELLERGSIQADDNWFHIGGHSLLALRLFARIHQDFGRSLPVSCILEHPTPRSLASRIEATPPETTEIS
jgi:amino acid adenylation domain-containing protein